MHVEPTKRESTAIGMRINRTLLAQFDAFVPTGKRNKTMVGLIREYVVKQKLGGGELPDEVKQVLALID